VIHPKTGMSHYTHSPPPIVIARSVATRQSSDRLGIPHVFALSLRGRRQPDAAIQRSFGHPPYFCVVIARRVATRQSSGRVRPPTASPRPPASRLRLDCHVSALRDLPRNDKRVRRPDCHALNGLAMTRVYGLSRQVVDRKDHAARPVTWSSLRPVDRQRIVPAWRHGTYGYLELRKKLS
jgi:hypothetical protein